MRLGRRLRPLEGYITLALLVGGLGSVCRGNLASSRDPRAAQSCLVSARPRLASGCQSDRDGGPVFRRLHSDRPPDEGVRKAAACATIRPRRNNLLVAALAAARANDEAV